MSQDILRAAIVGVGRPAPSDEKGAGYQIGYVHAAAYARNTDIQLVAGADIKPDNLRAFQQRFGVPGGYDDLGALLAEEHPDVLSIATYVGPHRAMIEQAAEAGVRGILCEKPFLNSPADIAAVRDAIARTGVKIVVAYIRRYKPAFLRAKEVFLSGEIGQPTLCSAAIPGWDLSEWGSHWLDIFRFFHDDQPVAWVMGQARVRALRVYNHAMEDHAVAYFGFEGGGKGLLDGGGTLGDATMILQGTRGSIRIYNEDRLVIQTPSGERTEVFADSFDDAWDGLVGDLVAWMRGGPEPRTGATGALLTSELNLGAYLSMIRGDRVDLPLDADALQLDEWPVEVLARRSALAANGTTPTSVSL